MPNGMNSVPRVTCSDPGNRVRKGAKSSASILPDEMKMELLVRNIENPDETWNSDTPIDRWSGVYCEKGLHAPYVYKIVWKLKGLSGNLSWLYLPSELCFMDVHRNRLAGEVDLSYLPRKLWTLWADRNHFVGHVQLSSLPSKLQSLYLSRNRLDGSVDLTGLPRDMQRLVLRYNSFTKLELARDNSYPIGLILISLQWNEFTLREELLDMLPEFVLVEPQKTILRQNYCEAQDKNINMSLSKYDEQYRSLSLLVQNLYPRHHTWKSSENVCLWHGMQCNAQGEVIALTLQDEDLSGNLTWRELPTNLLRFDISRNQIRGETDTEHLPRRLTRLCAKENKLSGEVSLIHLPHSLNSLDISYNEFIGHLNLSRLPPKLCSLVADHNQFTSVEGLDGLPIGFKISLHENYLPNISPEVRDSFKCNVRYGWQKTAPAEVKISPQFYLMLDALESQDVLLPRFIHNVAGQHPSWLTGKTVCIQWWPVICDAWQQVVVLRWSRFGLFGNLTWRYIPRDLRVLDLSENRLGGQIMWEALPSFLHTLLLRKNLFMGHIDLTSLPTGLQVLDLSSNDFSGGVSLSLLPPSMEMLRIQSNLLNTIVIPKEGCAFPKSLQIANLRGNPLLLDPSLQLPHFLLVSMENLTLVTDEKRADLRIARRPATTSRRCDQIKTFVRDDEKLYSFVRHIRNPHVSWRASNSPCLWHGVKCDPMQNISELRFESLSLKGNMTLEFIPSTLLTLDVSHNQLTGRVNDLFSARSNIWKIALNDNTFYGEIDFTSLSPKIRQLLCSHNQIQGLVDLRVLSETLQVLDIRQNKFQEFLCGRYLPKKLRVVRIDEELLLHVPLDSLPKRLRKNICRKPN